MSGSRAPTVALQTPLSLVKAVGPPGHSMLGLWTVGHAPQHLSLHLAFRTSVANVIDAFNQLRSVGVTPLSFFTTEADEPSVIGWMPAAAVYFRDPDGHLLEYLAMLDDDPRSDLGIVSWSQWTGRASGARPTI